MSLNIFSLHRAPKLTMYNKQAQRPAQYPPQQQNQYPSNPQTAPGQYPPPQQSYGGPPPPQQYGNSQPPSVQAGPQEVAQYQQSLDRAVQEKQLHNIIRPGVTGVIAQSAPSRVAEICSKWRIPAEIGRDLSRLGLYDVILYIDDSGSMAFEENGERIDDLKLILSRVAFAATRFDQDGISVRFMNTKLPDGVGDNLTTEDQINRMMSQVKFSGLTPMGRELRKKVVDDIVLRQARQGGLKKPVLVITVTDGQPAGDDSPNAVFETVRYAVSEVQRATGSPNGIAFQFAQVGNDTKAREFLGKLDTDATVGSMVDCTSNFEQEQQEMMNIGQDLTPDLWMVKLLLGSIDPSYDSKDEPRSWRPGGGSAGPGAPAGQYGAPPAQYGGPPPQQGYGAPGGGYGRPAPGPPGQPPYPGGGYPGQQQGGYPGQQQGGYPGQQQSGYPGQQQGGYGAAPPPPRY